LPKVVPTEMSSFRPVDPNKGDNHVRAVVLIDEIDKADPDTPNNLLVALGSLEFFATEANAQVKAVEPPLVIITSNDERELSTAFLRRCIMLNLAAPSRERLVEIARAHFGKQKLRLYREVAKLMIPHEETPETTLGAARTQQSAAELLDTVHACIKLKVTPNQEDETWQALSKATLWKPRESVGTV